MMKKTQLFILMLLVGSTITKAHQDTSQTIIDMRQSSIAQTESRENDSTELIDELTTKNAIFYKLSMLVLGFGLVIIGLETVLVLKKKIDEENTVRFIVVTLIIIAALFLITAGYSNNQIAPAMGLLGAIAGYLLGKTEKTMNNKEK